MGNSASIQHQLLMMSNQNRLPNFDPNHYVNDKELYLDLSKYPQYGIYEIEHIELKELANKPIEEQMKYSNAIFRKYAKNQLFINKILDSTDREITNNTTLGNYAFAVFYNPDNKRLKDKYDQILEINKTL